MTSNPTLLHFSARYNLVKLAVTILECPGGFDALNMVNEDGLVPSQIAIECGNDRLGSVLVRILLHSLVICFTTKPSEVCHRSKSMIAVFFPGRFSQLQGWLNLSRSSRTTVA